VTETRHISLGRAWDLLDPLIEALTSAVPTLENLEAAGDVRRYEPLVSSLVLIGRADEPEAALDAVCSIRDLTIIDRNHRRVVVRHERVDAALFICGTDDYGSTLFRETGAREHVSRVSGRLDGDREHATERDVYAEAGLAFVPPELRQDTGEIEAAESGQLPVLVDTPDIRGDFHMHTVYSDGRDTVATMVEAGHALGYEYIAITDHSEGAAAGRTLAVHEVSQQRDEIERLRDRFPGMTILHGAEVDILATGRLDFDDRVLEQFDIVLASLHDRAGHDGERLTRRCLQAIEHPLVNVVTHPVNRLVGRSNGYDLDFDAIYAAARETGTALEIDGAASHLDLDGEHARAAAAAGVTLTIDSDCHHAPQLRQYMRFGIGTARRGWVEVRHVLNTRPLGDVRAFIEAKRRGGPQPW
jgi:DNA polymerase (family X)